MAHIPQEKIVILDFSTGEVFLGLISQREDAEDFFERKGFDKENTHWMRGDIRVHIEDEFLEEVER